MSRVVTRTDSITVNPSGYIPKGTDGNWYSLSNPTNAYNPSSNTTYASVGLTRGNAAITTIYWTFDTSSIPSNATINSVTCLAKVVLTTTNSNYVATKRVQLSSGVTEKGDSFSPTGSATVNTLSGGTWTRSEVNDVRLHLYGVRGSSRTTTSYLFRFYGADLTIAYTYDATYYSVSGSSDIAGVTVTTDESDYLEGTNAIVTISGATGMNLSVIDNGVDVSGELVVSGSDYLYTINGIAADHVITVSESQQQGQKIFVKQNGSWIAVNSMFIKQNGVWENVKTLHIKNNGSWIN